MSVDRETLAEATTGRPQSYTPYSHFPGPLRGRRPTASMNCENRRTAPRKVGSFRRTRFRENRKRI
jgi:hypothetical protein